MAFGRWRKVLAGWLVAALVIVAGSSGAYRAQAQAPDVLVVAQGVDMQTGDPHKTTQTHPVNVLANIYDTLVRRDANLSLKPGLALSWQAVDPTTWEFNLRGASSFTTASRSMRRP